MATLWIPSASQLPTLPGERSLAARQAAGLGTSAATPSSGTGPGSSGGAGPSGAAFGQALGQALSEINTQQLEAEKAARTLASGKTADMTDAVVALEKASISFQFALQIRNKLLEAYQDVMRMSV